LNDADISALEPEPDGAREGMAAAGAGWARVTFAACVRAFAAAAWLWCWRHPLIV